jgi:hypothetical protein
VLAATYGTSDCGASFYKRLMKYLILFFWSGLLGHFLSSCTHNSDKTVKPLPTKEYTDTSRFALIKSDEKLPWAFEPGSKPATLSEDETKQLEGILKECVQNYNKGLPSNLRGGLSIDFSNHRYYRQYVAVVNDRSEKEIWVNGFCDSLDKQWRMEIVHVKDGGNCYFNMKINLTQRTCFEINVNEAAANISFVKAGLRNIGSANYLYTTSASE